MARNGSGTYTRPVPAYVTGTTISSSEMNTEMNDIAAELTLSLPRDGQAGMLGQFKSGDGTISLPGVSFSSENTTGFYRISAGKLGLSILNSLKFTLDATGLLLPGNPTDNLHAATKQYVDTVAGAGVPTGVMLPYGGTAAPTGWLLCDGSAVSRTTYAGLFAAIGVAYGAGDGSTTFNIPDLKGRIPVGKDNMGGTAANRVTTAGSSIDGATLGATGGAQNVQLTAAQNGAHTHSSSLNDPGHVHRFNVWASSGTSGNPSGGGGGFTTYGQTDSSSTGITLNNASSGTGSAHNNMPPSVISNYIIRT